MWMTMEAALKQACATLIRVCLQGQVAQGSYCISQYSSCAQDQS